MAMKRLRELAPFVKEVLLRTARGANAFSVTKLVGHSMLPAFHDGNIVLTESLTALEGKVGPGDVVLIRSPENPAMVLAKRVRGVAGDVVSYAVDPEKSDKRKTVIVPKGYVWIEGDNLRKSRDSRHFGPVPYALIQSRIFLVMWPYQDFRLICD